MVPWSTKREGRVHDPEGVHKMIPEVKFSEAISLLILCVPMFHTLGSLICVSSLVYSEG